MENKNYTDLIYGQCLHGENLATCFKCNPNHIEFAVLKEEATQSQDDRILWEEFIDLYDSVDVTGYGYGHLIKVLKSKYSIKKLNG